MVSPVISARYTRKYSIKRDQSHCKYREFFKDLIYAELIQNAVDAIRQSTNESGNIHLSVDCTTRKIKIKDDGVGIDKDKLPYLLKPFSTNKDGVDVAIGEKGVGLKFVIFSSNKFVIKTGNETGTSEAEIIDAYNWKNSTDDQHLSLRYRLIEEEFKGTQVEVFHIDNEQIFNLSVDQLVFLLRTRTAIGSTKFIWGTDKKIDITLYYKDINGDESNKIIPFKYFLVTDEIQSNSKIDLDDFEQWLKQGDRTDQEKMLKLKDKVIYKSGVFTHTNARQIKYYACFVPKRRVWDELSVKWNLASDEKLADDAWLSDYYYCKLNNGIFISVKGMPTGISVDHPTTGYAGYWANLFILFDDPFVKFDIGRKSIHGRQANIHRDYAKQIFNEFLKYVTKYVSGDVFVEPTQWDRDEIFAAIDNLVDLNISGISFQKTPYEQEASVAAIFYECIGRGKIKDITPIISGYRNKYDLYAKWGAKKIILEFKSHLANLAKDFNDARKMFDEIDCVVCWEITDSDKQTMLKLGVTVDEIDISMFTSVAKKIPHSTHVLSLTGFTNPIYAIDLKKILAS